MSDSTGSNSNAAAALLRIMSVARSSSSSNNTNNGLSSGSSSGIQVVRNSAGPRSGANTVPLPMFTRGFGPRGPTTNASASATGASSASIIPRYAQLSSGNGLAVAANLGRGYVTAPSHREEESSGSLQRLIPSITNYIRNGGNSDRMGPASSASSAGIASYYSGNRANSGNNAAGQNLTQQFQHAYNIYSQNHHHHHHHHHHIVEGSNGGSRSERPGSANVASQLYHAANNHASSSNSSGNTASVHPHFRAKVVCQLTCRHCTKLVCRRGMKAILLADANVELYSTDSPPKGVQLVEEDYTTANCRCKIRDLACLTCGNVIGYHVTQPCDTCLESCNNGHFWMFLSDSVSSRDRPDPTGDKAMLWAHLPYSEADVEFIDPYDFGCR